MRGSAAACTIAVPLWYGSSGRRHHDWRTRHQRDQMRHRARGRWFVGPIGTPREPREGARTRKNAFKRVVRAIRLSCLSDFCVRQSGQLDTVKPYTSTSSCVVRPDSRPRSVLQSVRSVLAKPYATVLRSPDEKPKTTTLAKQPARTTHRSHRSPITTLTNTQSTPASACQAVGRELFMHRSRGPQCFGVRQDGIQWPGGHGPPSGRPRSSSSNSLREPRGQEHSGHVTTAVSSAGAFAASIAAAKNWQWTLFTATAGCRADRDAFAKKPR